MGAFIVFVVIIYVLGLVITVAYNALMWNDEKDYGWDDVDQRVKFYARQVVLAPLWPRYAWTLIKKISPVIKNFFVNAKQLFKDAM